MMENPKQQSDRDMEQERPVQEDQQRSAPAPSEQHQAEPGQPEVRPDQREPGQPQVQPDRPQVQSGQREPDREDGGRSDPGPREMESAGLLPYHEADGYRRRWEQIQGSFVDDPRHCCEQADALVIEVLQRMSQIREEHRTRLRGALDEGGDTEGLRVAMQQYRAFFSGLLKA